MTKENRLRQWTGAKIRYWQNIKDDRKLELKELQKKKARKIKDALEYMSEK